MNVIAQKWGNSLAVRLPKNIAQSAKISAGTSLSLNIDSKGNIQLKALPKKQKLEDFMSQVTEENLHHEISSEELTTESW